MKELLPDTPVALLCLPGMAGVFSRSFMLKYVSPEIIHPNLVDVDRLSVNLEHKRGRRVHVWTVNADQDLRRMLQLKVDGIFTDDPLNARKLLK